VAQGCALRSSVTRFSRKRGQFPRARDAGVRQAHAGMRRRLVGSDVSRGGDLGRYAAIAVTKPPELPWTRRQGSHAVAQRRSASVDAGKMGAQARCITGAPRPCRLCRSHDAVQAQHAALGERASPIAVRLTTSPSRGSFEQVRSVSRQGNSAAGQGLAGDRSRGALALSSPIKGGEP